MRKPVSSPIYALKCSLCGCTGVHACLGKISEGTENVDIGSVYDNINDAIEHIIRLEERRRKEQDDEDDTVGKSDQ